MQLIGKATDNTFDCFSRLCRGNSDVGDMFFFIQFGVLEGPFVVSVEFAEERSFRLDVLAVNVGAGRDEFCKCGGSWKQSRLVEIFSREGREVAYHGHWRYECC